MCIHDLPDGNHKYLALSLRPHFIVGEKVSGTVERIEASGFLARTDDGHDVFVPWAEVPSGDRLYAGDAIESIWILRPGDGSCDSLGTMRPEGAMTVQKQEKIIAAMKSEWTLDGVVRSIKHRFADILVVLPDGTEAQGQLHGKHFGKGDHLSVGDKVWDLCKGRFLEIGTSPTSIPYRA